jgi:hypothetical protein
VLDLVRDERRRFVFRAHVSEDAAPDHDVAAGQSEAALDGRMRIEVNRPRQLSSRVLPESGVKATTVARIAVIVRPVAKADPSLRSG